MHCDYHWYIVRSCLNLNHAWFRESSGIAPCGLAGVNQRFRHADCIQHQGDEWRPDDGCSTHVWNIGILQRDYTALYPRRLQSSDSTPWGPQISHSWFIHQNSLAVTSRHLVAKQERRRENGIEFCLRIISFILVGIFKIPQNLKTWGWDFTSLPTEVVVRIFISLKNPLSSYRFEPANLGPNYKQNDR
jgi:hypothetical protein